MLIFIITYETFAIYLKCRHDTYEIPFFTCLLTQVPGFCVRDQAPTKLPTMAEKNERIYDELLSFLGDPMFQIPVRTFLDENCLSEFLNNFNISSKLGIRIWPLPFHNQGGGPGFYPGVQFFFSVSEWKYNFFSFQNESTIFFLLPIRPLFYYRPL